MAAINEEGVGGEHGMRMDQHFLQQQRKEIEHGWHVEKRSRIPALRLKKPAVDLFNGLSEEGPIYSLSL